MAIFPKSVCKEAIRILIVNLFVVVNLFANTEGLCLVLHILYTIYGKMFKPKRLWGILYKKVKRSLKIAFYLNILTEAECKGK